jgi:predicted SPOUT superfamily RNA methylase MTH1
MAKKKKKSAAASAGGAAGAGASPPEAAPTPAVAASSPAQPKQQQTQELPTTDPKAARRPADQRRRRYTLSLAVPASLVEDTPSAEAATLAAAAVARAAALHRVDELVIVDDTPQRKDGTVGAAAALVARVVQALETPPYLRPHLLPLHHPDLAALGACPPLELPHHLRPTEWCAFREGVVMRSENGDASCTFVDVGLDRMAIIRGQGAGLLPPGQRVTVRLGAAPRAEYVASHGESMLLGELADADAPGRELFPAGRAAGGWGFRVRLAKGMHGLLRDKPLFAGGSDGEEEEQSGAEGDEEGKDEDAAPVVSRLDAPDGDLAAAARRMMEEQKRRKRLEREQRQKQQQQEQQQQKKQKQQQAADESGYDLIIGLSVEEGQAVRRAEDLALPRGFRHALVVVGAPSGPAGGLRGPLSRDKRLRGKDLSELFSLMLSPLPTSAFFGVADDAGDAGSVGAGSVPTAALQRACRSALRVEDAAMLGLGLLSPALEAYGLGGGGGGAEGMMIDG